MVCAFKSYTQVINQNVINNIKVCKILHNVEGDYIIKYKDSAFLSRDTFHEVQIYKIEKVLLNEGTQINSWKYDSIHYWVRNSFKLICVWVNKDGYLTFKMPKEEHYWHYKSQLTY